MTTFDLTVINGGGVGTRNRNQGRMEVMVDTIVDFTSTTFPNSGFPAFTPNATTLSGNASGDTVKVFTLPALAGTATNQYNPYTQAAISATFGAACKVAQAGIEVVVADTAGNSGTLAVGDSGSSTRWYNATAVATTGFKIPSTNTAVFYTAANYIVLTVGTGAINCIVRVYATIMDYSAIDTIIWN